MGGRREFAFSTGGPAVRESSLPRAGTEWIDEQQAFLLVLDASVDQATILAHAHFVVEGVVSRVGARLGGGWCSGTVETQGQGADDDVGLRA